MKKILFLVICIAHSVIMASAQNEIKTRRTTHPEVKRMYRVGNLVGFVHEVDIDSFNCPTAQSYNCDGRSVRITNTDFVVDSTSYSSDELLKAYMSPNYFIEQSYTEATPPVKINLLFGIADFEIKTSKGYVYKKDENKIVLATQQSRGNPKVYLSVIATIVWSIVFTISLLVRGESDKRYRSGVSLIKWVTFSYAVTMTCFMMINILGDFYLHPNANSVMIWVCIGLVWVWFAMYHIIERITIDTDVFRGVVKLLILATLLTTILMYHGFVGERQLTSWLAESMCGLMIVILGYRSLYKKYQHTQFMKFFYGS